MELATLIDSYRRGVLSREAYFNRLRRSYHSLHARVRAEAVQLVDQLPEPERTRELLQFFHDCQWRETQIAILRALATQPLPRALEFLIHRMHNTDDLGLCREAIAALGRSAAPLAARALATHYVHGPAALKPYIAQALGELQDRTLTTQFMQDLQTAMAQQQVLWAQSLVFALAELKVDACLPDLLRLRHAPSRSMALAALLAIGKLARQPDLLESATASEMDDFVEWQIRTNARQQIALRARWSIGDSLERLFDPEQPLLPGLVLELNNFPAAEVHQGLTMCRHRSRLRMAAILARLDYPEVSQWSADLLDPTTVPDEELTLIIEALQTRHDQAFEPVLLAWRRRCLRSPHDALYAAWLRTCALTLPHGGQLLAHFLHSACFASQPVARRITALNQFVDHGLACLGEATVVQSIVSVLDALLDQEADPGVVGRILRGFAQLRHPSPKAFAFAQAHLVDPDVVPSVLQFLRYCPHQHALQWLLDWATNSEPPRALVPALLLAMAAQDGSIGAAPVAFDTFLRVVLTEAYGQEACLAALRFLTSHPRRGLVDAVLARLQAQDRIRVMAIVALKSYAEPRATPRLIPLLHDTSESIVGRTLDTLTAQPDDGARWAIVDFLARRLDDVEIADKIMRCLTPPRGNLPAFRDRLEQLITAHPQHELVERLVQLRDHVAPAAPPVERQGGLLAGVTRALDADLARRLRIFPRLDERVKAALRSAELPYAYPEMFHGEVDKSTAILGYCKAIDLCLERHLGRDLLFPRLYSDLAAFQNAIYYAGLNEHYPHPTAVLQGLGLQGLVMPEQLPLSKMVAVAHSILDGRIQQGQWRILDGLRAWSAVLLMFVRSAHAATAPMPPLPIHRVGVSNQAIIDMAIRLDDLQTLRNPVAHRRTLVEFADIETIQHDVADMFALLAGVFFVPQE